MALIGEVSRKLYLRTLWRYTNAVIIIIIIIIILTFGTLTRVGRGDKAPSPENVCVFSSGNGIFSL